MGTLVLETGWTTPEGRVRVVDFMPLRAHAPHLIRIVEGLSGAVPMVGELRLRFDFGRVMPWVRRRNDRTPAVAGPDAIWLSTPAPAEGREWSTVSEFTVHAGERVPFVMTWTESHHLEPTPVDAEDALLDTVSFWSSWSASGTRSTAATPNPHNAR